MSTPPPSPHPSSVPLTLLLPQAADGPRRHPAQFPPETGEAGLVALYADLTGAPRDAGGMWVRANMVTTLDGEVVGGDGRSGSISSPADKRVFSVLRGLADAVVVGGATARTERYTRLAPKADHLDRRRSRGQEDVPVLVLVSRSGDVDLARLEEAGSSPVLVHASAAHVPADRAAAIRTTLGAEALVLHAGEPTPAAVLADLRTRGLREILHEGGPGTLGRWVAAGCIDELCLTVSPVLAGPPGAGAPRSVLDDSGPEQLQQAVPLSILTDGSTLIQRWGLAPSP
ncbi:dihydrofolate reductase family protein [Brevibacterium salitolerans]|uniref:Pyrimidine reductase family protein n=1 Tax=Brevibacterium salitolerans TaxID=1403566 RepID=A0ABP5ITP7_9MICO